MIISRFELRRLSKDNNSIKFDGLLITDDYTCTPTYAIYTDYRRQCTYHVIAIKKETNSKMI